MLGGVNKIKERTMDFYKAVKHDEAKLRHSEQLMPTYFGSDGYDSHKAALRMARKWLRIAKREREYRDARKRAGG